MVLFWAPDNISVEQRQAKAADVADAGSIAANQLPSNVLVQMLSILFAHSLLANNSSFAVQIISGHVLLGRMCMHSCDVNSSKPARNKGFQ